MSSYSSVEDMQMHQTLQAHLNAAPKQKQEQNESQPSAPLQHNHIYPHLTEVPGTSVPSNVSNELCSRSDWPNPFYKQQMAAMPSSTADNGSQPTQVKNGIREVTIHKKGNDAAGLWVTSMNRGIFITFVKKNSAAYLAGLRCGDQILQLHGSNVFGHSEEKVYLILNYYQDLAVVVRNRPFEQTITLHKNSNGYVGFIFMNGIIVSIDKNSSAERNGLLIGHKLLEINGKDVDGMKDKDIISRLQNDEEPIITVTILPSFRGKKEKKYVLSFCTILFQTFFVVNFL